VAQRAKGTAVFCVGERAFVAGTARALPARNKEALMLWTIIVVLLVLWAVGLATSYTLGGLLHLLLLVALVMFVVQLVSGRRAV
jgi:hypothetical protein